MIALSLSIAQVYDCFGTAFRVNTIFPYLARAISTIAEAKQTVVAVAAAGKACALLVRIRFDHFQQIDLERLYCTLQRRFGRCNGGPSCAAGTVARSDVSATETTSSANFSTSLGGLSCAAVHRVRRNLFACKGGLSRLKHVFAEEAGRLGDGSLTKVRHIACCVLLGFVFQ